MLETMQETKKDLTVEVLWDLKEFLTSLSQKDKTANGKNMHDQLKRSKKEKRSHYCWRCLFRSSRTFPWLPGTCRRGRALKAFSQQNWFCQGFGSLLFPPSEIGTRCCTSRKCFQKHVQTKHPLALLIRWRRTWGDFRRWLR